MNEVPLMPWRAKNKELGTRSVMRWINPMMNTREDNVDSNDSNDATADDDDDDDEMIMIYCWSLAWQSSLFTLLFD